MTKFVHVKVLHCWKKLMQLQGALTNHPLDENVICLFKKKKKHIRKLLLTTSFFSPPCCYFILNKYLSATSATNYSAYKSHSKCTIFMLTSTKLLLF